MCSSLSQRLSLSRSMIKGDVETCKVACHALAFYPRRIEIIETIEAEPGQRGQRVGFAIQRSRVRLVSFAAVIRVARNAPPQEAAKETSVRSDHYLCLFHGSAKSKSSATIPNS